jgi:hypothetical protein
VVVAGLVVLVAKVAAFGKRVPPPDQFTAELGPIERRVREPNHAPLWTLSTALSQLAGVHDVRVHGEVLLAAVRPKASRLDDGYGLLLRLSVRSGPDGWSYRLDGERKVRMNNLASASRALYNVDRDLRHSLKAMGMRIDDGLDNAPEPGPSADRSELVVKGDPPPPPPPDVTDASRGLALPLPPQPLSPQQPGFHRLVVDGRAAEHRLPIVVGSGPDDAAGSITLNSNQSTVTEFVIDCSGGQLWMRAEHGSSIYIVDLDGIRQPARPGIRHALAPGWTVECRDHRIVV